MKFSKKLFAGTLLSACVISTGVSVHAQEETESAVMTPAEQAAAAQRSRERIASSVAQMEDILDAVQNSESTTEQIRCASENVASANAYQRMAAASEERLGEALAGGDQAQAEHESGMIAIAEQAVGRMMAAAQQCAGDTARIVGSAERSVDIGPSAPDYDSRDLDDNSLGVFLILESVPDMSSGIW